MPTPGKHSFHLKGTEQDVLNKVLSAYGLTVMMDSSVGTQTIRFDADDVDYEQAAALVSMATGSFIVPLDPKRVLAARDTKGNRTQYDRVALETLRLPGLTPAEMSDMGNIARTVVGVDQATVQQNSGTLTVRAPHATLAALNGTLGDLLDGRSEVLLDVRVIEVSPYQNAEHRRATAAERNRLQSSERSQYRYSAEIRAWCSRSSRAGWPAPETRPPSPLS